MLNTAIIMGRIASDLSLKSTQGGVPYLQFTLAVERSYVDAEGNRATDFIQCIAWRQTAEWIAKYFGKGRMLAVTGTIQTGTHQSQSGETHYDTTVSVSTASFTGEAGKK